MFSGSHVMIVSPGGGAKPLIGGDRKETLSGYALGRAMPAGKDA
jgi:hypothetical protein